MFDDINRDGIINNQDLYQFHKGDPDYFFGASSNVNINRNLNLGFVMRASIGNYVYNNNISSTSYLKGMLNTSLGYLANAIAYNLVAGQGDKFFLSDYYVQNASFVKLDNIYANYTFRNIFGSSNLTVNANIQNVFTITNYIGLDPEIQSGVDRNVYPRPTVMSLGLNLTF